MTMTMMTMIRIMTTTMTMVMMLTMMILVVPGRCDPFALGYSELIRATSGGSIRCESNAANILRPGW
eukprot:5472784-Prorocentrum_lima.AAC.1